MKLTPSVHVIHEALLRYRIHPGSMMATQSLLDEAAGERCCACAIRSLYDAIQLGKDRVTVAAMRASVADEVRVRRARYPENPGLQEAAALAPRGT